MNKSLSSLTFNFYPCSLFKLQVILSVLIPPSSVEMIFFSSLYLASIMIIQKFNTFLLPVLIGHMEERNSHEKTQRGRSIILTLWKTLNWQPPIILLKHVAHLRVSPRISVGSNNIVSYSNLFFLFNTDFTFLAILTFFSVLWS